MKFAILAAAAVISATVLSANAALLFPDEADGQARQANNGMGAAGTTLEVGDLTAFELPVGEYFGGTRSSVIPYQLPTLAAGSVFTNTNLRTVVFGRNGTPPVIDLYGLGVRTAPDILSSDFYSGALDLTDATLLQQSFTTGTTPIRNENGSSGVVETSVTGDAALAAYLNAAYANGANAGRYVFLRLSSTDAAPAGFNVLTFIGANAGGFQNADEEPFISYNVTTGVPEPTSLALLSLGGLAALRRRSR